MRPTPYRPRYRGTGFSDLGPIGMTTVVVIVVAVVAGLLAFANWLVMLAIGGLHSVWPDTIPALGYWATAPVTFALLVLRWVFGRS